MKKTLIAIFLSIILSSVSMQITATELINQKSENITIINVALYPKHGGSDELIQICLNYTWEENGNKYRFNVRELNSEELRGKGDYPLNKQNFDVFIVGANFNSYINDGRDENFQKTVKKFLSDGGGFLGVCAGAFVASQGYEQPDNYYEKRVNEGVLKIADIYLNDDFDGELQYLLKELGEFTSSNVGQISIEVEVNKTTSNPIFSEYNKELFNIAYGGGAGMYPAEKNDPKLGTINPLFTYNEELMETKPINYWKKALIGWKKSCKIQTDMKGQYGGIATTYNNSGRIVLLSSHPEITVMENGTIEENFGKNILNLFRVVYIYKDGEKKNMSYNYWIHRRTVAWLAKVPDEDLPPVNELMVFIDKPQFRLEYQLYLNDDIVLKRNNQTSRIVQKITSKLGKTIIIGPITIEVYGENCHLVEFYIDDVLEHTRNSVPCNWTLDKKLNGIHKIEVRGYDEYGNYACDGSEYLFYNYS